MKTAHISDLHYSPKHLKWVDRAMVAAVDRATKEGCDAAVIAGDSFDHGMGVHEPAVLAYVTQVARLADTMPTVVLYGTASHDRPGSLDILRTLRRKFPIHVADRPRALLLQAGEWYEIDEDCDFSPNASAKAGDGVFFALPSLNKANPAIMEHGAQHYVGNIMQRFAIIAAAARQHGLPTTLVTHGTVNGSLTESKFAIVSPDHEFAEELLFRSGADAIMTGHIHAHQDWHEGTQIIAYPGSLARLVHGDHDPKGWLLWDIEPGSVAYRFIPSPTRQLLEIEFDGPPDMGELGQLAADATEDDAVRIRWTVDQEYAATVDKPAIRALFGHCDAVKLEGTVLPIQSVRAAGISRAATLDEKLAYWLKTTGDEDQQQALEDRLEMLRSMEAEEIVNRLLGLSAAKQHE